MTDFVENSFSLNNQISISNKIKNIPYFFIYFNSIDSYKNLNKNYKILPESTSNVIQREIKYKIITHINNNCKPFYFTQDNFLKSLYHLCFSLNILRSNNISFTIHNNSFVYSQNNLPVLMDFSYSFNLSSINFNNIKMFFSPSLLNNKYIPLDVFIITYLIHHSIKTFNNDCAQAIIDQYASCREKIKKERLLTITEYFNNYDVNQIIKYLFQFKSSWCYYSFCYYFICNHSDLLSDNGLLVPFYIYINSDFKERNNDLINDIHNQLFDIK
jgi:hypothetical protein